MCCMRRSRSVVPFFFSFTTVGSCHAAQDETFEFVTDAEGHHPDIELANVEGQASVQTNPDIEDLTTLTHLRFAN